MAKKKDTLSSVENIVENVAKFSDNIDKVDTLLTNNRKAVFALVIIAAGLYVYQNERRVHIELAKIDKENEKEREDETID